MGVGGEVAAGLRAALEEMPALDQHAHLLSGPGCRWALTDLLSESAAPDDQARVSRKACVRAARQC